jgi:hypothetical protein
MSNTEATVFISSNSAETLDFKESTEPTKGMKAETEKSTPKPLFHDVLDFNMEEYLIASLAEFFGTLFFIFMALTAVQVHSNFLSLHRYGF